MPRPTTLLRAAALSAALVLSGCAAAPAPSPTASDASASTAADDGPVLLGAQDAVDLLAERGDVTVIDVRTPEEHAAGHLEGTLLLDIQAPGFDERLDDLDRDGAYLVYCRTGNRSATAVATMADLGFTEVYDAGGYDELAAAGAPTAP